MKNKYFVHQCVFNTSRNRSCISISKFPFVRPVISIAFKQEKDYLNKEKFYISCKTHMNTTRTNIFDFRKIKKQWESFHWNFQNK